PARSASLRTKSLNSSTSAAMRGRSRPSAKGVTLQSGIDNTMTCSFRARAKVVYRAAAVLVVDADEQGNEIERPVDLCGVDRRGELTGRPAGSRDDARPGHLESNGAQCGGEPDRPARLDRDRLADGVRVAEGEEADGAAIRARRSR